jgi:hypothetical protein
MRSSSILACLVALTLLSGCKLGKKKGADSGTVSDNLTGSNAPSSKEAALDTIIFKKKDPVVGTSFNESSTMDLNIAITSPKKSTSTLKESTASKVDILGADGKTITKAKVTYTDHSKSETDDGRAKNEVSPVTGKSYLAEFKDKKLLITDENHKKVSAKEEKVVRGDLDDVVGKPDPLLTEMPGVPMKVGDKADSLSEALRDLLSGDDKADFSDTSVRLKEISFQGPDKVGTFDVKTKVTLGTTAKIILDISGTMTVREADARLTSIKLQGPLTMSAGIVKADGAFNASQTRSY